MSMFSCMVVEDEPLARGIMEQYISGHPSLRLTAMCGDAFEAQQKLMQNPVDILFLDINLPGLSGINFLKTLLHPPAVVMTTAYPEYAAEGFELDVADYLVKPFSFERFIKAVNKAIRPLQSGQPGIPDSIFVKEDRKVFRIAVDDILDLEAMGDYVRIRTTQGQHMVNSTLKDILEDLPGEIFIRVHKSFAISRKKISFLEGNYIRIAGKDIPIGATYREKIISLLGGR